MIGRLTNFGSIARTTRRHSACNSLIGRGLSSLQAKPPSQAQRAVSRRLWEKYREPPKPKARSASADEKPWPRNVQIAGYVAAGVSIPYIILWFISTNGPTRDAVFKKFPSLEPFLRQYFGMTDLDHLSYVDVLDYDSNKDDVPYKLEFEANYPIRCEQMHIDDLIAGPLSVRVRVYPKEGEEHGFYSIEKTVELPGSTAAKMEVLLDKLDLDSPINKDDISYVSVDFKLNENTPSSYTDEGMTSELQELSPVQGSSELTKATNIFSSWHYLNQPTAEEAVGAKKMSDEDIKIATLEYEITALEEEIRKSNTSRSIDDTLDDLKTKKKELSEIRWKRRLRFLG